MDNIPYNGFSKIILNHSNSHWFAPGDLEEEQQHPSIVFTGTVEMSRDELVKKHEYVKKRYLEEDKVPEFSELFFLKDDSQAIKEEI